MAELGVASLLAPGNEGAVTRMNGLSALLPVGMELLQQWRLRNDPRLNALLNEQIGQLNYRRQTGGLYGDAATGWGGGMGVDSSGNALTPGAGTARYMMSQVNSSGDMMGEGNSGRAALASRYGVPFQGQSLGVVPALNPDAVRGVPVASRPPVFVVPPVERPVDQLRDGFQGLMERLGVKPSKGSKGGDSKGGVKGSYAVGTTSVPETGQYELHQGEMVIPAPLNPVANGPGVPLLPRSAVTATAPGLSAGTQQQIVNRGKETIDTQLAGTLRGLRSSGAASGQINTGAMDRRMFDARLGAMGAQSNLVRDVGIEAENRRFGDSLAMDQAAAERAASERSALLQAYGLRQEGDLTRAGLAQSDTLERLRLAQERGLAQGSQALQARGLGIQERGLSNDYLLRTRELSQQGQTEARRLALERELGVGSQNLQRELGRGQLEQQAAELAQQGRMEEARRLLERELGLGSQGLQRELGLGGLEVDRLRAANDFTLGQGQLGYQNRTFDANYGRDLLNDSVGQQQWMLNRNDALMRDLFGLGAQADESQQQAMQSLMELLAGSV